MADPRTQIANPPNPWHRGQVHYFEDAPGGIPRARLQLYPDNSKSILSRNDSPDLGFRWSVNPYRGCVHGCAYCYARPSHEYLDWGSGTDFERKIVVKERAPELLREAFERRSWVGERIVFSGNTDCYQALEGNYRLTRRCLEVCAEYRNPVAIITKSPLIERDLDVLRALDERAQVGVMVSLPFWRLEHARAMEPWVPSPKRRMQTIARLADAGIPVGIMVAPLIPGLNDEDMPTLLERAAEAGATRAGLVMLRLPGSAKDVFVERLRRELPLRAEKILTKIREARGGELNDSTFGARMRGHGPQAAAMRTLFELSCAKHGLATGHSGEPDPASPFERPPKPGSQLPLFG